MATTEDVVTIINAAIGAIGLATQVLGAIQVGDDAEADRLLEETRNSWSKTMSDWAAAKPPEPEIPT